MTTVQVPTSECEKCTPLHISILLNIHCSPVLWDHHRSSVSGKVINDLEAWGMCENGGTNEQQLTDKGRAWMNSMLIVPQDDQGASTMTNQAWVPEVGERVLLSTLVAVTASNTEINYGEELTVRGIFENSAGSTMVSVESCSGTCLCVTASSVEPLPADEDKAVEEMVSIVTSCKVQSVEGRLRELYRAGYRKQEAQPDLSDPANWKAGDELRCTRSIGNQFTKGKVYVLREDCNGSWCKVYADDLGNHNGMTVTNFAFHSH